MGRERNNKVLAIVALCVAIFGLTIGFAAFSNTLTISSSATVSPNKTAFNVDFSTSDQNVATSAIVPSTTNGATGTNASIDNSNENPVIGNVSANFSEPGQSVTYDFFIYNSGEYDAFLNSAIFGSVPNSTLSKVCSISQDDVTAGRPTASVDSLAAACEAINIEVIVGEGTEGNTKRTFRASETNISDFIIAKKSSKKVSIVLTYAANGARADGNFKVDFGDIALSFGSAEQ